jgi:NAD(P)-dependent dehydrogenase (short-subunit alcohol dehydrogenase family)
MILANVMKVNVRGTFVLANALLPRRNTNSVVIGTSTAIAMLDIKLQQKFSSYAASKLAIIRLFEVMAAEYPDTRFVTFHPGIGLSTSPCCQTYRG